MTPTKLLALVMLLIAVVVCVLYFLHALTFDQSVVLEIGDIAVYQTGALLIA